MTEDNDTKRDEDTATSTEIVVGAPVKITRARAGSLGKDTQVDLIPKPDGDNWLDVNLLNEPSTLHNQQTGYDKWVERTGRSLENIDAAEDVSILPEMLAHEDPLVQEAAENKLRELKANQIELVLENEESVTEKLRLLRLRIKNDRLDEAERLLLIFELRKNLLLELEALENDEHPRVSGERKKRFDALDMAEENKE